MSLGERIKQARNLLGYNMRDLARKVGVSHNAISKYERGEMTPSSGILIQLATALEVQVDYFFRQVKVNLGKPQFRSKIESKEEEKRLLAKITNWLERYLEVEEIFSSEIDPNFQFPTGFPQRISQIEDVEDAAGALREVWSLGSDPIDNLVELLEEKGFNIFLDESNSNYDACLIPFNDNDYIFSVNLRFPGDRQRLSLAHELGHLLLKIPDTIDSEQAANRFGAALLVPKSTAISQLGKKRKRLSLQELYLLKHKYGLSMQAWIRRAGELGIISNSHQKTLLKEFKDNGWREIEPGDQYQQEKPHRMERLVYKALAEDLVSESKASDLLGKEVSYALID
ncbi:MAG: ImmA/IrrE family metallo-endopeptidase [Desulfobacteraceae bacterium]|nr:ImmA/IrrE family metallo-endopeptidase [Desulfobacteraceae bacterium]